MSDLPMCVCADVYGSHPPDCPVRMEIERLRAALQKIANHNDGELLTREADDMANIARAALDTVDEKERT